MLNCQGTTDGKLAFFLITESWILSAGEMWYITVKVPPFLSFFIVSSLSESKFRNRSSFLRNSNIHNRAQTEFKTHFTSQKASKLLCTNPSKTSINNHKSRVWKAPITCAEKLQGCKRLNMHDLPFPTHKRTAGAIIPIRNSTLITLPAATFSVTAQRLRQKDFQDHAAGVQTFHCGELSRVHRRQVVSNQPCDSSRSRLNDPAAADRCVTDWRWGRPAIGSCCLWAAETYDASHSNRVARHLLLS